LGLYVHVPFCKELCPFCPYYKIKYDASLASKYVDALIKEIHLKSLKVGKKRVATSLYFAGGSPSLIINSLEKVLDIFREHFVIVNPPGDGSLAGFLLHFCHILRNYNVSNVEI